MATTHGGDDILPAPVLQDTSGRTSNRQRSNNLASYWTNLTKYIGSAASPTDSSVNTSLENHPLEKPPASLGGDDTEEVDEIVVDRSWSDDWRNSDSDSDHDASSPGKSGPSNLESNLPLDPYSPAPGSTGFWVSCKLCILIRWRIWPAILGFFSSRFLDEASEQKYRKENWSTAKSLATWASLFLALLWLLGAIFAPRPFNRFDKLFFYVVSPLVTLPLFFFALFDFPRDRPIIYQLWLCSATYSWSIYLVLAMSLCGFYNQPFAIFSCGTKDFTAVYFYATALPTVALFGMKLNRFPTLVGAILYSSFYTALVIPYKARIARGLINFLLYIAFLLYTHFMRENAERRLFILREELKLQFKEAQRARVNERQAADSKRRLTSYIFHDKFTFIRFVRVPLNTALLAVQNMEASGTVAKEQEIEFRALQGSLSMMSKVLNDILDFNRLDSGKFESVSRPYAFHPVMHSLLVPLRMATDARGLELVTNLDESIDEMTRMSAYLAFRDEPSVTRGQLRQIRHSDGIVIGDETRLRQIVTNLASNACKFTPAGGKLTISTKLVLPTVLPDTDVYPCLTSEGSHSPPQTPPTNRDSRPDPLSIAHLSQHNIATSQNPPPELIVVRIEVTDTGFGIRGRDMVQNELFSAFNQTEQGRQQGGKGTGLGLALVRQIVKRSGGRLGVRSKIHQGSTFWVELPLGVANRMMLPSDFITDFQSALLPDPQPEGYVQAASLPLSMSGTLNSHPSERRASVLHGLMEQGGRVELVLANHDSPSASLAQTLADPTSSMRASPNKATFAVGCNPPDSPPATESEPSTSGTNSVAGRSVPPRYVQLPRRESFSTGVREPGPDATPQSQLSVLDKPIEVLVVDDDSLTRTLMSRMLSRMGCRVSLAENGEVALEMILRGPTPSTDESHRELSVHREEQEHKYSVVFLDNQMPVMSGLKAVAKLREMGRKDFVVGVTGNALLSDQQEYLDAGVDYVLTKPVLARSLIEMFAMFEERRAKREY